MMKEFKNPALISIHHVPSQEWATQFANQRQWSIITCSSPLLGDLLPILHLITGTEVGDVLLDASHCTLRRLASMSIAADQGETFNQQWVPISQPMYHTQNVPDAVILGKTRWKLDLHQFSSSSKYLIVAKITHTMCT
jgi:hypothetical protein